MQDVNYAVLMGLSLNSSFLDSSPTSTRLAFSVASPTNTKAIPQRLKIGLLSDTFLPVSNGVTHTVASLARIFVQQGHEPHIFTFAPTGELQVVPEGLLDDPPHFLRVPPREGDGDIVGVPIHYAPALPILETGYYFGVRYPLWMRGLLREMDVLHVHHPYISGRLARRLRRDEQPILFTNHTRYDIYTHYFQSAVPRQMQPLTQPLTTPETLGRRFAMRAARFANACDAVIAPSASMQDVLAKWGVRAPVHVIPNGVDLTRFDGQNSASSTRNSARNAWRARRQIALDAPLAIYLGRLAPEKNGRVLLEAFARSQQEIRGARLLIVGDGPSDEEWREWTKKLGLETVVHFAGALPPDEVPQALSASDVFVSASVSEVHPLTLIEAMASGLPCIGTPSPGVQDTVRNGINGWLAQPQSAALSEALTQALGNETERRKRGAQAQLDSQKYSIEENAARVMQLYRAVLNARLQSANE